MRALRLASPARPAASPVTAATAGALLAWAAVGDPSDLPALADRLAGLAGLAAMALAVLRPGADRPGPASAGPGCRAGLFDCSMPAWPAGAWRDPARSPLQLAALVMLPMMWGLPQMLALCRSAAWPAQAVLGLHLAAMFLPACVLGLWRDPPRPPRLAGPCAVLLVLGAGAAFAGGPWAGWGLALAHGMAWSLAWAARLAPGAGRSQAPAPWRAGALSAGLVLLLGALQALGGASTLTLVHGLLGLMAAAIWLAAVAWRPAPALLARPTGPG